MDQIHLMNVFVAVGEEEGFAAAARRLDLSPAAVTRAIASLEEQLGVRLLLRTTRNVRLTEAGQRYLDDTRAILASIEEANQAAAGVNAAPKGNLTVTAPVLFGKAFVMPCILRYLDAYPEVDVSALFLDRIVNLVDEGIDVAVRIGSPEAWSPSLGHSYLGQEQKVFCAAPAYLAAQGTPASIEELAQHAAIMYRKADGTTSPWLVRHGDGRAEPRIEKTALDARIVAGNAEAQLDLTLAGLGIAQLPTWLVGRHLAGGSLVQVLPAHAAPGLPMHVVWPKAKAALPRVSQVVAALSELPGALLMQET